MSPMVMRGGQTGRGRGRGKQGFSAAASRQQTLQRSREQIYGGGRAPGGGSGRGRGGGGSRGRGVTEMAVRENQSPRQHMQSAPASTAVGFSGRLRTTGTGGRKVTRQSQATRQGQTGSFYGQQRVGPSAPGSGAGNGASSGFYASRPASK